MADITYCCNSACTFDDCERYPSKGIEVYKRGEANLRIADFSPTCRRYIGSLVDSAREQPGYTPRLAVLLHEGGKKEVVDLNEVIATPEYVERKIEEALKSNENQLRRQRAMTRAEAIEVLENGDWWDQFGYTWANSPEFDALHEAIEMSVDALRVLEKLESHSKGDDGH